MNIVKTQDGGTVALRLSGRLDTTTAPLMEAELSAVPEDAKALTLDLEELEYISSAGLRVLLAMQKRMNAAQGAMKVLRVNEGVMEVFDITGFSDILTIE